MTDIDVHNDLLRLRDEQLRKLVEMARDRKAAEVVLSKAYSYERAAKVVSPTVSTKYGKHKSTILAILDFLEEIGRPASDEEIIKALVQGGFRGGDADNVRTKVRQCISTSTRGLGRSPKRIKRINSLIGRGDWQNGRFMES